MGGRSTFRTEAYRHAGFGLVGATVARRQPVDRDFVWLEICLDRAGLLTQGAIAFMDKIRAILSSQSNAPAVTRELDHPRLVAALTESENGKRPFSSAGARKRTLLLHTLKRQKWWIGQFHLDGVTSANMSARQHHRHNS